MSCSSGRQLNLCRELALLLFMGFYAGTPVFFVIPVGIECLAG
ncbi:MAG: hypothetical protein XXXJIFNMEKO3_LKCDNKCA_00053 (plasmid) [Candidatus Erwinia impunctatus]